LEGLKEFDKWFVLLLGF
jgi:predicted MFS family arabinose efflux permease